MVEPASGVEELVTGVSRLLRQGINLICFSLKLFIDQLISFVL